MSENPDGAISLEQAVGLLVTDETPPNPEADDTQEGESEAEDIEAGADTEDEGEPEPEPEFEVETAKGKRKVKLSELLESPMFKDDYTRKTMALADERKENERRAAENSQKEQQLEQMLQTWAVQAEAEPDWQKLAQTATPQEFNLARARWEDRKRKADAARAEYQAMQERTMAARVEAERVALIKAVPEWGDQARFVEDGKKIVEAGKSYGFSDQEIGGVIDHRMLLILRDAAAYRELKAKKPEVSKKVETASVTLKPGSKPKVQQDVEAARRKQMDRLKQSGRIEDAVSLLRS